MRRIDEYGRRSIYYDKGFMHAKTIVIDDEITSVGQRILIFGVSN